MQNRPYQVLKCSSTTRKLRGPSGAAFYAGGNGGPAPPAPIELGAPAGPRLRRQSIGPVRHARVQAQRGHEPSSPCCGTSDFQRDPNTPTSSHPSVALLVGCSSAVTIPEPVEDWGSTRGHVHT